MTPKEIRAHYSPSNPFAEKAASAWERYNRVAGHTAHDAGMARSFPLGPGYGRKGAAKRLEAHIARATKSLYYYRKAKCLESQAEDYHEGRIDAQSRSLKGRFPPERKKNTQSRTTPGQRIKKAKELRGDKPAWTVPATVWADATGYLGGINRQQIIAQHQEAIEQALADGHPVPVDVLTDYPTATEWGSPNTINRTENQECALPQ